MLKSADAYNNGLLSEYMYVMGASGQTVVYLVNQITGAPQLHWFGMYVFEEGETISARAGAGTWDISLSGFLLSLP